MVFGLILCIAIREFCAPPRSQRTPAVAIGRSVGRARGYAREAESIVGI